MERDGVRERKSKDSMGPWECRERGIVGAEKGDPVVEGCFLLAPLLPSHTGRITGVSDEVRLCSFLWGGAEIRSTWMGPSPDL